VLDGVLDIHMYMYMIYMITFPVKCYCSCTIIKLIEEIHVELAKIIIVDKTNLFKG